MVLQKILGGIVFYFIHTSCDSDEIRPLILVGRIKNRFMRVSSDILYTYI